MRIIPLSTGAVSIKESQRRGEGTGLRRRMRIFRSGPMTGPLPILAWAIAHADGVVLVDSGERATARDQRFASFAISREDELDRQLAAAGIDPREVHTVVLTHTHGDHVDGLPHVAGAKVLAGAEELRFARSLEARLGRLVLRQPFPPAFAPEPIHFDGPPIGAFPASAKITPDGRILAVPTPGHTPGHIAVLVVEDDHHVLLAGDLVYDEAQLLERRVDGISPDERVARATIDMVIEHARQHATVVLPTHDPDAAARLEERRTLDPSRAV